MSSLPDHFIRPSARCVICTTLFNEKEVVALVTSTIDDEFKWTRVFNFPAARITFECWMFGRNGKPQRVKLCYNPDQCSNGSTFHQSCFEESKVPGTGRILHLENIWTFSLWARPWETAPSLDDFETSQHISLDLSADEVTLITPAKDEDKIKRVYDTNKNLNWRLYKLPPEIKQEILAMAHGSPLWRIFAARKWGERLPRLTGNLVTLSISDVKWWQRSGQQQPKLSLTGDIITIAIDNLGIRSVTVSNSWPSTTSHRASNKEAYIVEHISILQGQCLEKQGDYCRFQKGNERFRLWDTPAPPLLHSCRFKDKQTSPLRLKTIRLDTSLRGLSVFCYNGFTYRIHPHYTDDASSILDIFNRIPLKRRKTLIWMFCPLAQQQIKDTWLRHDSIRTLPPILVMRTTRDQEYTFGPYRNSGCSFQYLGSTPSHIVFESVPLGAEIPAVGIATDISPGPYEPPQSCYLPDPPLDMEWSYCCSAPLMEIQCVTTYCLEGYCIGIMITYSNGLQKSLGQCRPDADWRKVDKPFGFHHKSSMLGQNRKEMVEWSSDLEEYQVLEKFGWESIGVGELKWLSWWFSDTSSFCLVFAQPP